MYLGLGKSNQALQGDLLGGPHVGIGYSINCCTQCSNNFSKPSKNISTTGEGMDEEPVPKLKNFSQAIVQLHDVKLFLESSGCIEETTTKINMQRGWLWTRNTL